MDNDLFGHVNNVTYYSYFDTVCNQFLIEDAEFNPIENEIAGYIVSSHCDYFTSIAYPERIQAGFRVNRIGNSSVEYGVGIFNSNSDICCAYGTMTHVFVSKQTQQSVALPKKLREIFTQVLYQSNKTNSLCQ